MSRDNATVKIKGVKPVTFLPMGKGKIHLLVLKPYVYETIKGKRKRVNPLVVDDNGVVIEIKQRGIVSKHLI